MDAVAVPHRLSVSATALGPAGSRWLGDLPGVLAGLATDWSITYGRPFDGGNAAYVIEAVTADARPVILKVALPPGVDGFSPFKQARAAPPPRARPPARTGPGIPRPVAACGWNASARRWRAWAGRVLGA